MPQINFRSPGVSAREIDLTGPTSIEPVGIPAGIISTTQRGPAFVPQTLPTIADYNVRFGFPIENVKFGALAANEWLRNAQALTQLRVLGIGDGSARTLSGINKGKVNSAGYVVGDQQPQSTLSGALGPNLSANERTASPFATGSAGRTYFLGCFMSQSVNSAFFTDAGLTASAMPIIRGVLMAASGVVLTLSTSNTASTAPLVTQAADYTILAQTIRGAPTGTLNLTSGKQEFVMFLNGFKAPNASLYPNLITASFDTGVPNYFGTILNKDPLKLEDAGYVLYTQYDITPSIAVPTGSGIVLATQGAGALGLGYERIAFLVTGSQTRNSGSTTAPNFENFEDRFRTASTPWILSQKFGGNPANLFKIHALDDGEYPNSKIKVSIENIAPSRTDTTLFGSFDLVVRDFGDTDANKVVLEQWRGLSLDATSNRYIAKIIGDVHTFYNLDTPDASQKLTTEGDSGTKSKYIRVQMSDGLTNGSIDDLALPMGFRGVQHLVTSGSAPLGAIIDAAYFPTYVSQSVTATVIQPPVPMRLSLSRGVSPNKTADRTLYWGVQFEQVNSALETNASSVPNTSLKSLTKYFPNFHTDFQNVVVRDNEGTADTAANGILDADRFNNNQFSLEKVQIYYNATSNLPDLNQLQNWTYVRQGNIIQNTTNLTRALKATDLSDPGTSAVSKFTVYLEGGFDGVRPFNVDTAFLTNNAVVEEMTNTNRGFSSGPTVKAYLKALTIVSDTTEIDIQILAMPGIRHRFLTDTAIRTVEQDRFDTFYIMDIEERDSVSNLVTSGETQNVSVRYTVQDFNGRGLNSSFAAAYFPDQVIRDPFNGNIVRTPPSVAVLGAFAKNDAVGHPWFAPAGFTRAALNSVQYTAVNLSRQNMDDLYSSNVNPIVAFAGNGPVVWGQKTVQARQSSLDRVNVRRLLLTLRREVKKVANRILFEPARDVTLERFQSLVTPILKRVQEQGGLDGFDVQINTSTTTQADLENKTIRGKIFIVPTKTLEFMSLDFVLSNRGAFVS